MEQQLAQLKQGQPSNQVLGYATTKVQQLGIPITGPLTGGWTQLNNLTSTVLVGTKRLVRLTAYVNFQGHGAPIGSLQLKISVDDFTIANSVNEQLWSVADAGYVSAVLIAVHAPAAGTHPYMLAAACSGAGGSTIDAISIGGRTSNYLLVEDIGLAPA